MAIAQEIIITASGLSFEDWIASLTGDAKTEAEAVVANRNTKFDAQVAAGNVYFDKDGKRVWVSAEAEQAHMEELGQTYADLWAQWEEETGGTLTVNVIESPAAADIALSFPDWASKNLSESEFNTVMNQVSAVMADEITHTDRDLTEEEAATLRAGKPELDAARKSYKNYLASL